MQVRAGALFWCLHWRGNQHRAQETIACCEDDVGAIEVDHPNLGKRVRTAREFAVYNTGSLVNHGKRLRAGEHISSCLAESTVNAIISKRFATRPLMQQTRRGTHPLPQTRTRTRHGTLRPLFERWYPGLANDHTEQAMQMTA